MWKSGIERLTLSKEGKILLQLFREERNRAAGGCAALEGKDIEEPGQQAPGGVL